jgi:transposase
VESQTNRLKVIKRQMHGPSNLDLLDHRFLLAAHKIPHITLA